MKMVSMKLDKKKDKGSKDSCCSPCCDPPEFPYGLQISLDIEQIKKLGEMEGFDIDDKVTIQATGSVTRLERTQRQDGDDQASVSIQIESIAISADAEFEKGFDEAAKKKE